MVPTRGEIDKAVARSERIAQEIIETESPAKLAQRILKWCRLAYDNGIVVADLAGTARSLEIASPPELPRKVACVLEAIDELSSECKIERRANLRTELGDLEKALEYLDELLRPPIQKIEKRRRRAEAEFRDKLRDLDIELKV